MRYGRIMICFLLLSVASCSKSGTKGYKFNASIIGLDARACACCGGYFISIDGLEKNGYFLADKFPDGFVLEPGVHFPVRIYLEWVKNPNTCVPNGIIIQKISTIR